MPPRKTTSTSAKATTPKAAKATSSKASSSEPKEDAGAKTEPETFGQLKFKGAPSVGAKLERVAEPCRSSEPQPDQTTKPDVQSEQTAQPENKFPPLEKNQWVKIHVGEFVNRVGLVDTVNGDVVTLKLQGQRLDYSRADLEGLEATLSTTTSVTHYDRFYRTFHVFTANSVTGGIDGNAINRDLDIRLERQYHGVSAEEVGAVMVSLVDAVIEERELDIPQYQPRTPVVEKSASVISAEITARNQQEAQAYRDAQTFTFEAISGLQAGGLIFSAILSFKEIRKLVNVNLAKIPPEERYQRIPSASRVKAIANYVIQYPDSYVLPSLTCTIEGEYEFVAQAARSSLGKLTLKPGTKLHPIDGGHRLNAIASIINQVPKLADEEICVKFVIDRGLKHRRQLFSDVNKEQVKPPKAISLDFDRRSREANFHRDVIDEIPLFAKYTERTKGSAGGKGSNNLFVLTWLHGANKLLRPGYTYELDFNYSVQWWTSVVANTPILRSYDPQDPRISPEEVREHLCCTALTLKALATVGHYVSLRYRDNLDGIEEFLKPLAQIDWCKSNPEWEGLIIETVKVKAGISLSGSLGEKKKIISRNTEQLVEYLKNLLIKF